MVNTNWAFAQYELVRKRLPPAPPGGTAKHVADLGALVDDFDVILLDAYGVLNVGDTPVPGAPGRVKALQRAGKRVMVLTNGASFPAVHALAKYHRLGYDFTIDNVIASRDMLLAHLAGQAPLRFGAMAHKASALDELGGDVHLLDDNRAGYDRAEGFLLIGTQEWSEARQDMLVESLRQNPRPVLVGNPDLVAPYEHGFTLQPGLYGHRLAGETGIEPVFLGKPFAGMFAEAQRRIGHVPPARVLMVGDTLHTDILGAAAMGFKTLLATNHGMFKGGDVMEYIEKSGIWPDFIAPSI